jgi:hypothetical protein
VGPRAGLDGCGKSRPPPGFDPRTVQPVASRYIDYSIPTAWTVKAWYQIHYIALKNVEAVTWEIGLVASS